MMLDFFYLCLAVIPLYSFLITVLGQLLLILEPALVTVTLGDHLWAMLNHLEDLTKQHRRRITEEQENGIRQENPNTFALYHLNVSTPSENTRINSLLQSDLNLETLRGQCVLISGPSGCGKTSLFRICAGLRQIDAQQLILPKRQHLLFIPQRPYLPVGDLRFQALFLLEEQSTIKDDDLYQLFQKVNLQYLLDRYTLYTVADWPAVLSVGEQQRLAFIRLFAFLTLTLNADRFRRETLVLLDESTSAIDTKTEQQIYDYLTQLQIWFVTISHRPSLVHFHEKSLYLSVNADCIQVREEEEQPPIDSTILMTSSSSENNNEDQLLKNMRINDVQVTDSTTTAKEKNTSKSQQILQILKFIHVPFQSKDRALKLQVSDRFRKPYIRSLFFSLDDDRLVFHFNRIGC